MRSNGGILLISSSVSPMELVCSSHIRSRMMVGSVIKMGHPMDDELRPIMISMLERRNLRLSDYSIDYLLKRLPVNLSCYNVVIAKINELSYWKGKPAKLGIIKEALALIE